MLKKLFLILFISLLSFTAHATGIGKILNNPVFQAVDASGIPLSGGLVYSYVPGTTTAKATYSDKACTVENTNPVVLDSNGQAIIYLLGATKINLKSSAGVQQDSYPIDYLQGFDETLRDYYYPDYNATDQGITGDSNTLKYYIDTIGADTGKILLRHNSGSATTTYTLTTSETIPENITLEIEPGAIIDGAGTLTINGPFSPGPRQVFGSSITLAGMGRIKKIYPEWWGATGDGVTDDTTEVQAAVSTANSVLLTGSYLVSSKLTAEASEIKFASGAKLIADANVNVLELVPGTVLSGSVVIDVSQVSNYTAAALELDGDRIFENTSGNQTFGENITIIGAVGDKTGTGIHLHSDTNGGYIIWTVFKSLRFYGLAYGIKIEVTDPGGGGNTFINGNTFDGLDFREVTNGIYIDSEGGTPASSGGNIFTNIQWQTPSGESTAIYCAGTYNQFSGMIWDIYTAPATGNLIQFTDVSEHNILISNFTPTESTRLTDDGTNNVMLFGGGFSPGANKYCLGNTDGKRLIESTIMRPNTVESPMMAGVQDNYLSFADRKFTVTQTDGPAVSTVGGAGLHSMFDNISGNVAKWTAEDDEDPVIVEIDLTNDPLVQLRTIGFLFAENQAPVNIKVEYYTTEWITLFDYDDNDEDQIEYDSTSLLPTINKLRFTMSVSINSTTLRMRHLYVYSTAMAGGTWIPVGDGDVYGDTTWKAGYDPVITSPDGTEYRIEVANGGALSTTAK